MQQMEPANCRLSEQSQSPPATDGKRREAPPAGKSTRPISSLPQNPAVSDLHLWRLQRSDPRVYPLFQPLAHPPYPNYCHQHAPPYSRPHPLAPAAVLQDFGFGPTPLFGWDSVMPLAHGYGQPKYFRRVKPDYRRFCYPVGKADVPYAALPGGPLQGFNSTLSPQLVGRLW